MATISPEVFPFGIGTLLSLILVLPIVYYAYVAVNYIRRMNEMSNAVNKFPGPKPHWLLGNFDKLKTMDEEGLAWMRQLTNEYVKCFRIWFGPFRCSVWCVHPDPLRTIMRSTEPKQMGGSYGMITPWLGEGLLLSSGSKWRRNRRLLTPAFHFDVLKPYMKIYNEATDIFVDKLLESSKSGVSVDICRPVTLLTLNVILRCAFSSDMDVQRQSQSHPYVTAVLGLATLFIKRFYNPMVHQDFIYSLTKDGKLNQTYLDRVHGLSEDVIVSRKKTLRENPDEVKKRYPDFLDILLLARDESGQGLTDREIRDEVDTFLFEGHDTTASAISWIMYEMARNPDHQLTCREEIDQFMDNRDSSDMEWSDLSELPFTTQCIKEAMRVHAPVPFIAREVSKEFVLNGVTLKPGTFVDLSIYLCSHNPDVWGPDHMEFKPERFSPDKVEMMDSFAFLPFSAGPRNCIGQNFAMHEIKVVTSKLLHRFVLTDDKNHTPQHNAEMVMRSSNGIKMFIKPRA